MFPQSGSFLKKGIIEYCLGNSPFPFFPSLVPQKGRTAWPTQVADHLVPNQILGFFEFFREIERGKYSVFKGLQKPLSAQIQEY